MHLTELSYQMIWLHSIARHCWSAMPTINTGLEAKSRLGALSYCTIDSMKQIHIEVMVSHGLRPHSTHRQSGLSHRNVHNDLHHLLCHLVPGIRRPRTQRQPLAKDRWRVTGHGGLSEGMGLLSIVPCSMLLGWLQKALAKGNGRGGFSDTFFDMWSSQVDWNMIGRSLMEWKDIPLLLAPFSLQSIWLVGTTLCLRVWYAPCCCQYCHK